MLSRFETVFSGNPLDRADKLRETPDILTDRAKAEDARFLIFADDKILTRNVDGGIVWLKPSQIRFLPVAMKLFLGLKNGAPHYALRLGGTVDDFDGMFEDSRFRDARGIAMKHGTPHPDLGIIAQAKSMLGWHISHLHCSHCGHETEIAKGGYERACPACQAKHFPRTDPVVIMLATFQGKALIGRGAHLPAGFYSALAGYMEPGETIEEAVARELHEEAGIRVRNIRYVASQPWPWPSSLMIGCMAEALGDTLTLDPDEIEDACWITRDEARDALSGAATDFFLPPNLAIAHTLITAWLDD